MPAIEICLSEMMLPPGYVIPPRLGARPADWAAYRGKTAAIRLPPPPKPEPEPMAPFVPSKVEAKLVTPASNDEFYVPAPMTRHAILSEVALDNGMLYQSLLIHSRTTNYVHPRQEAMYRLRVERGFSYPQIGKYVGGFDHTTVISGIRAYCLREEIPLPKDMTRATDYRMRKNLLARIREKAKREARRMAAGVGAVSEWRRKNV